jgi:hypothetical protein
MVGRHNKLDTIGVNFRGQGGQLLENEFAAAARPLPNLAVSIDKSEGVAGAPSAGPALLNDLRALAQIPSRDPEFSFGPSVTNHWSPLRIGKETVGGEQKSMA